MTRSGAKFWWKEDLPKHIIYLYRGVMDSEWQEYTRAEFNAKKKERQESNIVRKCTTIKRVPCFIHVFKLNSDFLLGGWYIVVWSVHGMWYLNWKTDSSYKDFFPRIKQFLTFGLLPFDDDDAWFDEFCKAYPMKPRGIQRPRGKYLTHCIIDSYNNLIDIDLGQKVSPQRKEND
jgi:hypothetical protein